MLQPGTLIAGRYEIRNYLNGGGYGSVYAASDRTSRWPVAVKVFEGRRDWSLTETQQFKIEATVSGMLNSEHIVKVSDAGYDAAVQYAFIVMEYLDGKNLQELLQELMQDPTEGGPLEPAIVVEYLKQVASGLDKAHGWTDESGRRCPILHLDLKPANLFLAHREDRTALIKILDWGLSKVQSATLTVSREGKWSPQYVAPETLTRQRPTPATDTRALGLIAFFLLTGRPYWMSAQSSDGNPNALYKEILDGPNEPASERIRNIGSNIQLPPAFDEWFAQAVHLDPAQRFQEAGATVAALAVALNTPRQAPRSSIQPSTEGVTPSLNPVALASSAPSRPEPLPDTLPSATEPRTSRSWWSRRNALGVLLTAAIFPAIVLTAKFAGVVGRRGSSPNPPSGSAAPIGSTPPPLVSAGPLQQEPSASQPPGFAGPAMSGDRRRPVKGTAINSHLAPLHFSSPVSPVTEKPSAPSTVPSIAPPPNGSPITGSDGSALTMSPDPATTTADDAPAWQRLRSIRPKERHPRSTEKTE